MFGRKALLGLMIVAVCVAAAAIGFGRPWQSHAADLSTIRTQRLSGIKADLEHKGLSLGSPILIRIFKQSDELELWIKAGEQFRLYKTFPICTWSGDLGPKLKEGDGQAPEGFYTVGRTQMKPDSQYHLAFNLGYPNAYDRANGRTGSFLMVHGNCVSIGCYAMTDTGIEEIWLIADEALKKGQPAFQVHSFPFRMTEDNMERHQASPWIGFWQSLKPAYDDFEQRRIEPKVSVVNKAYKIGT